MALAILGDLQDPSLEVHGVVVLDDALVVDAEDVLEGAYDTQHPSVAKAMRNYSALLRDMSRDAEADDLEKRANDRSQATEAAQ